MSLIRCTNGHYYDQTKHSSCPHCGVNVGVTMPKQQSNMPQPAGTAQGVAPQPSPVDDGKTVGIFKKQIGIDPVVGWLVCIEGVERGCDYRIRSEKNFIGRSERMDIQIAGDESVSRENHAVVSYSPKNNTFRIYNGDSRGLVYLNGEEVITPLELKAYDTIELGQTKLLFIPFCSDKFKWEKTDN